MFCLFDTMLFIFIRNIWAFMIRNSESRKTIKYIIFKEAYNISAPSKSSLVTAVACSQTFRGNSNLTCLAYIWPMGKYYSGMRSKFVITVISRCTGFIQQQKCHYKLSSFKNFTNLKGLHGLQSNETWNYEKIQTDCFAVFFLSEA